MNSINPRTILATVLPLFVAALLLVERSDAWNSCTPTNCVVSAWTSWSTCTANCGARGTSTRSRFITRNPSCGGTCPHSLLGTQSCDCTYTNPAFGPCSHPCGTTGTQSKTKILANPTSCGKSCASVTETQACNRVCCPKDCNVTSWTPWTACTATCDRNGVQSRTRNASDTASCGGTCPALNESQSCSKTCNNTGALIVSVNLRETVVNITYDSFAAAPQDAVFTCTFEGDPQPNVKWYNSFGEILQATSKTLLSHDANSSTLKIVNVTIDDHGSYFCNASNSHSFASKSGTLNVVVYPAILTHPQPQEVPEGSDVTFSCNASGFPTPEITWKKGSAILTNSSSSLYSSDGTHITIANVADSDTASYICVASNGNSVTSNAAQLTVQYLRKPVVQQPRVNLNASSTLSIQCSSTSRPAADVRWFKYDSSGSTVEILKSNMLLIPSVNRSDAGIYVCNASNVIGSLISENVSVSVQYIDEPTFNTTSNITVNETAPLYVSCSVDSNPAAQYKWTTSSGQVVSNSAVLGFDSVSRSRSTAYKCTVLNAAGAKISKNLNINVQYIDEPKLGISSASVTLNETAPLSVNCSVTANPIARFIWATSLGRVVSNSAVLAFNSISRNNESIYQCIVTNAAGSKTSKSLSVIVQYFDGPKLNSSTSVTLNESDPFYVSCSSNSNLPATYQWTLKSGTFVSNSPVHGFNSISRNDEDIYQCTVKSAAGTKTSEFLNITVQYIDWPTLNKPNTIVMNETASLSIRCSATSKPAANYVWTTNSGKFVSNGATLSFGSLRRTDSNEYECKALNAAGSKMSSRLTMNVQYIDKPTFNASTIITMNETGQLYVSCLVTSNPSAQYEWTTTSGKHISHSALLAFDSINRSNDSAYQCKVMNAAGSKISTSLTIIVQFLDPPVITTNGSFSNGTNASMSCSFEGKSQPAVSWQKDDRSVKNGSTIQWQPILISDNGSYTCHVSNVIGIKTKRKAIIVKYPPILTVTSSVSLPHVAISSSLALTCTVSSEPVSNVTWKKNNVPIKRGNSTSPLVVALGRLQHVDTAVYTCSAENREGQKSVIKQVVVQGPPDPPTGIITSQHGSRRIQLRWTAPSFVGNSPITTYKIRYGEDKSYKLEVTGNVLSYNFMNLKPFTTYYFRLVVLNSQGSSSPAYFSQKTKIEDPPKPTNLPKVPAATSPNTATITMQKFNNDFGVIRFYQVIVMKVTSQSTTAPTNSLTNLNGFSSSSSNAPYITAEFSSSVFDKADTHYFVIGDQKKTNKNAAIKRKRRAVQDYYNAPLLAESTYKVFYRAYINDNTFTSTDWIELKTKQESGLPGSAIAGILIGCNLLAAFIVCAYAFYKKRNKPEAALGPNAGMKGEFHKTEESRF